MAWEQGPQIIITRASAGDLSAKQYHFVKQDGSAGVTACTTQGETVLGVLQNKPTTGEMAEILIFGISKLKVNDVIDDNESITTETDGKGDIAAASDYVAGKSINGTTSADGDIIVAAINCMANYVY